MTNSSNDEQHLERTMRGRAVTVDHSRTYWCRHEGSDGVRTHRARADHRYRVGTDGKRWPLCEMHAEQWRRLGLIATRPGPAETHRRAAPHTTFNGWAD